MKIYEANLGNAASYYKVLDEATVEKVENKLGGQKVRCLEITNNKSILKGALNDSLRRQNRWPKKARSLKPDSY